MAKEKYPQSDTRFPGSYGSAYLYYTVPRVILFREEHSRRVFVDKVDFISAPGWSPPGIVRRGGPHALITSLCIFLYDKDIHRFRLSNLLPGVTIVEVQDNTGFQFDCPDTVGHLREPEPERVELIRYSVSKELAETYPEFAKTRLGWHA